MKKILFVWELGAGLGHVSSQRPLAERLQESGHNVMLAVRNLRSAASAFDGSGLRFIQCPYREWQVKRRFHPPLSYAHMLDNIGFDDAQGLASLVAAWTNLFDLFDPDMIIFDHSPTALLAARSHRAKRVLHGLGFIAPPAVHPLPPIRPEFNPDMAQLVRDEEAVLSVVNSSLSGTTAPSLRRLADIYSEIDLNLLMTYEELDHFGARQDVRYWGVQNSTPATAPVWPKGAGVKIFAYLKPYPGLADLMRKLRALGRPTIVFGTWVDENAKRSFGSNTLTLVDYPVNINRVASECDLAILNGTHGTTAEMLLHGVPVLQIPIFVEQALTGQRTEALGAGLMADPRDAAMVNAKLTEMLSSNRFRLAASGFSAKYRSVDRAQLFDEMTALPADLLS